MISGLSEDMQALYAKSQADDWEAQQKAAQVVAQTEERKIPQEESRLLAVAASQVLGAEYNSEAIADVTWQPVNEEFALPDDEQFYEVSAEGRPEGIRLALVRHDIDAVEVTEGS